MSNEIVIPVLKRKKVNIKKWTSFDLTEQIEYTRVVRRYSTIEKQIHQLYLKILKAKQAGFEPTTLIINELDYKFLQAYHNYVLSQTYYSSPFGEKDKFKTIFGLKVILTTGKRPSVGWEP
jgi:hypothetical protein